MKNGIDNNAAPVEERAIIPLIVPRIFLRQ